MKTNFVTMQTERLLIRDHKIEDLETHHNLLSNGKIMYYLQDIQTHTFEESKHNLLDAISEIEKEDRTEYFLRIEKKDNLAHIGEIGYTVTQFTPFGKIVNLGYFTYDSFWGNGYVTEALTEVLRFAFLENDVFRITTGCITENKASERVMQKCNLIKEAEFKNHTLHDGTLKDRVEYRILKNEWKDLSL